jgi:hypothetical protein
VDFSCPRGAFAEGVMFDTIWDEYCSPIVNIKATKPCLKEKFPSFAPGQTLLREKLGGLPGLYTCKYTAPVYVPIQMIDG